MKIGLFDSGLGGLTILRAVARQLPQYDYCYFGDTEHLPLGDKTEAEVFEYTKAGVEELFQRECVIVIIACNTASAETLRKLQDTWLPRTYPERRILGVIVPTVEEIIELNKERVLLLATKRTIESEKYAIELKNRTDNDIELITMATPELVPMIESGAITDALSTTIGHIEAVGEVDVVVLGCTHYTELKKGLRAHFKNIHFLSQDEIIPSKLQQYLDNHPELRNQLTPTGDRTIHLTKHRPDYDVLMKHFLSGA